MNARLTPSSYVAGVTVVACLAGPTASLHAQGIEVAPFGGYRFGGEFFELITGQQVDLSGAPAFGVTVDVPLSGGLQIEGLYTHQHADLNVPTPPFGTATLWRMTVDHWQAGGLQEFSDGRARPFLTGLLGLTHYAADTDSEIRFTLSAGGGVKLFPSPHLGFRFDGRVFATFVNGNGSFVACGPGICLISLHVDVVWQSEFTAGVIVRFH